METTLNAKSIATSINNPIAILNGINIYPLLTFGAEMAVAPKVLGN
jgi:hypothetical protein